MSVNADGGGEAPLFLQLESIFVKDPNIDEYDFVPLPEGEPPFLVVEHKLAINMTVIKPLFRSAHAAFSEARMHLSLQEASGSLPKGIGDALLASSRALLMINADVITAWNSRKALCVRGDLSEEDELAFVDLLFTKHTKKPSAWAHRLWCLERLRARHLQGTTGEPEGVRESVQWSALVDHELEITRKVADLHARNYYAWTHRLKVVKRESVDTLRAEVDFAERWTVSHVSDASAHNYMHQVLAVLVAAGDDRVAARIDDALRHGEEKLDKLPGYEACWYHRRALLQLWLRVAPRGGEELWERVWEKQATGQNDVDIDVCRPPLDDPSSAPTAWTRLSHEVSMALFYYRGHRRDACNILWDAVATRRQQRSAWAHLAFVARLGTKHSGCRSGAMTARMKHVLQQELDLLTREEPGVVVAIPPGYLQLLRMLE